VPVLEPLRPALLRPDHPPRPALPLFAGSAGRRLGDCRRPLLAPFRQRGPERLGDLRAARERADRGPTVRPQLLAYLRGRRRTLRRAAAPQPAAGVPLTRERDPDSADVVVRRGAGADPEGPAVGPAVVHDGQDPEGAVVDRGDGPGAAAVAPGWIALGTRPRGPDCLPPLLRPHSGGGQRGRRPGDPARDVPLAHAPR
jgi:hypothetical protein